MEHSLFILYAYEIPQRYIMYWKSLNTNREDLKIDLIQSAFHIYRDNGNIFGIFFY